MRIVDPETGRCYVEKRRRRYNDPGHARELTFSCYRRYPFLSRERTRDWFGEALKAARSQFGFQLWAYVFMPEHVHLLVFPGGGIAPREPPPTPKTQDTPEDMTGATAARQERGDEFDKPPSSIDTFAMPLENQFSRFLQAVKEPVARKAVAYLKTTAPEWLARLTVREGKRVRHRFWQPGGGYDRNVTSSVALRAMIDYIHANPVRRGLVSQPEEWEWSSARWYAGMRPAKIDIDSLVLDQLVWAGPTLHRPPIFFGAG
jgi:putative transposase